MPRNTSDQQLNNSLVKDLKDMKKNNQSDRTNQLYPLGAFVLPASTSTDIETNPAWPNGTIYYATDLTKFRKLEGGVWKNL